MSPLPKQIAVVGAGAAGCYTAQSLRKLLPDASIHVFEALPTPFGLIRYGVAPDHQGTKAVTQQFSRLFSDSNVHFHGGVRIGSELSADELCEAFDAVVLATGLGADRPLPVPGAYLPGVYGSGEIVKALNTYPDSSRTQMSLGETTVVIGMGNVALDVVRIMSLAPPDLNGTDVDESAWNSLRSRLRVIHVASRSTCQDSAFDTHLLREIGALPGIDHVIHRAVPAAGTHDRSKALEALPRVAGARVQIQWWFGYTPEQIHGQSAVESIDLIPTSGLEGSIQIQTDSVVTAIGFTNDPRHPPIPVHSEAKATGRIRPGLYVAGWLRHGSRGKIADQRGDARQLAEIISDDLARPGSAAPRYGVSTLKTEAMRRAVDFTAWRRMDQYELTKAASNRVRQKIRTTREMYQVALRPASEPLLMWGIHTSLIKYMSSLGDFSATVMGEASFDGRQVAIPLANSSTGKLHAKGSVVFEAHDGALRVALVDILLDDQALWIADPDQTVDRRIPLVRFVSDTSSGSPAIRETRLTAEAEAIFMYNYPANASFDPLYLVA